MTEDWSERSAKYVGANASGGPHLQHTLRRLVRQPDETMTALPNAVRWVVVLLHDHVRKAVINGTQDGSMEAFVLSIPRVPTGTYAVCSRL